MGSSRRTRRGPRSSTRSSTTSPTACARSRSRSRRTCPRRRRGSSRALGQPDDLAWEQRRVRPAGRAGRDRAGRAALPARRRRRPPPRDRHPRAPRRVRGSAGRGSRARAEAGVERVVTVGTGIDSCRAALALAAASTRASSPCSASTRTRPADDDAGRLDELRELAGRPTAVAVGETGLDFFRDYAPRDGQRDLFERAARARGRARQAGRRSTPATPTTRPRRCSRGFDGTVVLHCFSSPALLPVALERGYYVSFAGNVTYPKRRGAARGRRAGCRPTACSPRPTAPTSRRSRAAGGPNEPANVVHTLAALAQARGEEPRSSREQIDANATAASAVSSTLRRRRRSSSASTSSSTRTSSA